MKFGLVFFYGKLLKATDKKGWSIGSVYEICIVKNARKNEGSTQRGDKKS